MTCAAVSTLLTAQMLRFQFSQDQMCTRTSVGLRPVRGVELRGVVLQQRLAALLDHAGDVDEAAAARVLRVEVGVAGQRLALALVVELPEGPAASSAGGSFA